MAVYRKTISFAQQICIDRRYNEYVYGGNWNPYDRSAGSDCSGCVTDVLDAVINGTGMAWQRAASTEDWRPPGMGGSADITAGPFGTVMVDSPDEFPADAAVLIALHHGPGGGENSHMWCQVDQLAVETHGSDDQFPDGATVLNSRNSEDFNDVVLDVRDTSYANSWWFLPGPIIEDGTPIPTSSSPMAAKMKLAQKTPAVLKLTGEPTHAGEVRVQAGHTATARLVWEVRRDDGTVRTTKRLSHVDHWKAPK